MNGVREHYKEHGDIDSAIRNFPRRLVAERAIVSVFSLPFLGLLLYLNIFVVLSQLLAIFVMI
jgi:hypothetical protein